MRCNRECCAPSRGQGAATSPVASHPDGQGSRERAGPLQETGPEARRISGMRKTERGFTLMELMVVIVIVAILAAVAVPLYVNYVKDAQRTEAKGAIGAVITAEQTWFQQN